MAFYEGDQVSIYVAFTNAAGVAADPTDVTLAVANPHGVAYHYVYSLGRHRRSEGGDAVADMGRAS